MNEQCDHWWSTNSLTHRCMHPQDDPHAAGVHRCACGVEKALDQG